MSYADLMKRRNVAENAGRWYIAVPTSLFEDSTYEATAKQIAKSLK
jgi:hypothetical protein